jgi:hypothetical protein
MFTDIKGPFKVPGLHEEVYAQSFIEGQTKFLRRYYFQFKSEALKNLKHLLEVALKSEQTRLLSYCSDGAPELISRSCLALLAENGCKFLYSPPYAPKLNAVVERNHQTTFESAHAMLIHSLLPNSLWTYAAEYATHIFNCLPTNTSSGYMSPYQARYGLVPDVSHLRTWGCLCYCHIPAATRTKGFIDKSYKAYFLGIEISSQAYILWIIEKSQVKISSDVQFDEFTKLRLAEKVIVPVAPETKHMNNYVHLIGMVYRDDENSMLYVSTRLAVQ